MRTGGQRADCQGLVSGMEKKPELMNDFVVENPFPYLLNKMQKHVHTAIQVESRDTQ